MYTYRSEKVRNLILTSVADRQEMGNGRLEPGRDATIKVDEVPRSDSVQHSILAPETWPGGRSHVEMGPPA